jgi:hypothetical protein
LDCGIVGRGFARVVCPSPACTVVCSYDFPILDQTFDEITTLTFTTVVRVKKNGGTVHHTAAHVMPCVVARIV